MDRQIIRKPALCALGTKYGGRSIVAVSYILFFLLDQKEPKNQDKTMLLPASRPPPLFCRANALDMFGNPWF